jgi:hypothetical protein
MKGINFSLKELLFGMDTMKLGAKSTMDDYKSRYYNSMDLDEEPVSGQNLDKGKGIDREAHPNYDENRGVRTTIFGSESQPSDEGNGKEVAPTSKPPFAL